MKKLLLLFFVFPIGASAQDFWSEISSFSNDTYRYAMQISIADEDVLWVRSEQYLDSGTVQSFHITNDGGTTWIVNDFDLGIRSPISFIFLMPIMES